MNKISSYLGGREPLWKAFWLIYILGWILFPLGLTAVFVILGFIGVPVSIWQLVIVILVVLVAWLFLSSVAVWRCAPNTGWVGWTYLARAFVLLYLVIIIAGAFERLG